MQKKLSMYACVTKVIPEADVNDPSKISGCILLCMLVSQRLYQKQTLMINQRSQAKFQLETNKMTAYETCNSIWSIIINKQSYDIK
ncbi:hypothetical protein HID58_013102 [Brassica napus]|uniref:Uncharacterized protein n=1 Tax=Brassica napus TaxID=3708 RepID=A0ABQ8E311_BRANA|nr:hypothetical protein HID58_013102 [Brassica napus]